LPETAGSEDTLTILIYADPDSIASGFALKRLFWRKVKKVNIIRINKIERADILAFISLLNLRHKHIRNFKSSEVTKWAIVDSQPNHSDEFSKFRFDIIIDHHPVSDNLKTSVFAATLANWRKRCSTTWDPPPATKAWPMLRFPSSRLKRMLKK
jgi:nanoRNase/pAp phosphatase (c-di-AMP/oligoRNAs hydrolase)